MPRRAQPLAPRARLPGGGCTFAEDPCLPAPLARVVWSAAFDPEILSVAAVPAMEAGADTLLLRDIAPWLTIATDCQGIEHVLLSDGWHHIRLDVAEGRISGYDAVRLNYRLSGLASAEAMLSPLRRFLGLCRQHRFVPSLFPSDPRVARGLEVLRISDALNQGASQRDIALSLVGPERAEHEWTGVSDSLRSRVKRLIRHARHMAGGGYRALLRKDGL